MSSIWLSQLYLVVKFTAVLNSETAAPVSGIVRRAIIGWPIPKVAYFEMLGNTIEGFRVSWAYIISSVT